MKYYNQSDLFRVLLSAARNPALAPDAALLAGYKVRRLEKAVKALRARNLFLYTEGTRTSVNLNDITTIYTQPAGQRMLVVGYSDNLRYGVTVQQPLAQVVFPQTHRVYVVGRDGKNLQKDFMTAQSGSSGQPRYTSTLLPVPFILEANEQIAVDLGYDTAMSEPANIPPQAFVFFCVKIKDRLTSNDYETIEEIKTYVRNHDYQRGMFLNCQSSPNTNQVVFDTALAGGVASCETRPASGPLLITGIGTTLGASKIKITDTLDSYSFSLNRFMQSSALNMPRFVLAVFDAAPAGAPIWQAYYDFPIPHLLRPGAALHVDVVNGGNAGGGVDTVLDNETGNVIMFQAVSV